MVNSDVGNDQVNSPTSTTSAPLSSTSQGQQTESISHVTSSGTGLGPVERRPRPNHHPARVQHDQGRPLSASTSEHETAPTHQHRMTQSSSSAQLYPRAGRGEGPARFGGMGQLGIKERRQQQRHKQQVKQTRQRAESQSNVGTGYRSFMNMISALAQEDQDDVDDQHTKAEGAAIDRFLADDEQRESSTEDATEPDHDEDSNDDDDDDDRDDGDSDEDDTLASESEQQAQDDSLKGSRVSELRSSKTTESDESDGTPPSFLSPSTTENVSSEKRPAYSEDEDDGHLDKVEVASSIHAIHRPIAARRRTITGEPGEALGPEGIYVRQGLSEQQNQEFSTEPESFVSEDEQQDELDQQGQRRTRPKPRERSETVVSKRSITRRVKLAEKLSDVFGIDSNEAVIAEFPCWLFRSILLQGHAFLTTAHLCFYAYLQKKEGAVERSGAVSCRGSKTRRYFRHWFVLKDDVLSWYPSSTEPYFPDGHIDLHYCTSVEKSTKHKHHFKVSTNDKRWHFSADSQASRDEWVKALKKAVFRCQNEGESVKISIPLEAVIDIERSNNFEFAETIRVRVYDAEEGYSVDEYWFSYFQDTDRALRKMTTALQEYRNNHPDSTREAVAPNSSQAVIRDSTERAETTLTTKKDAPATQPTAEGEDFPMPRGASISSVGSRPLASTKSGSSKLSNLSMSGSNRLRIFPPAQPSLTQGGISSAVVAESGLTSSTTTLTDKHASGTATPREASISSAPANLASHAAEATSSSFNDNNVGEKGEADEDDSHRYPPSIPPPDRSKSHGTWMPSAVGSTLGAVPSWLKNNLVPHTSSSTSPSNPTTGTSSSSTTTSGGTRRRTTRKIVEVVSASSQPLKSHSPNRDEKAKVNDMSRSVWDDQESVPGQETGENEHEEDDFDKVNDKFRKHFGLTDKESVVAYFPGYLFRGLPIYGKIYISTTFLCFKSGGFLSKTKMILPLADVINLAKHRSYRIGYSGLVVTIKGHEELFFELATSERRDDCMIRLDQQVEFVQQQLLEGKTPGDTIEHQQHLELLDLAASKSSEKSLNEKSEFNLNFQPPPENIVGQPPVMFCSTSSDFVTFRPEKALRFTCLTIGSRGDVQPYIALCKGLMAEGHTCTIASHAEYKQWVEGHGIKFQQVGGDPADLMELMIAHDFFTLSFMKEAIGRFRGWLDDLLESAWQACQDADVLIESPSAIAGYHVAEALRIPYYRAFTMTWTRTRAYPHAFAVPEVKMGGGYNFMTYTMFDQVFWRAMSSQVNRWRKKTLGLNSTNLELMQQHKIPFLYNFSPTIVPPPLDWRENIHVTGYWFLDNPDDSSKAKWDPPQNLLNFLDKAKQLDKKVVFIGFGSIIIPDPEEMTRIVTEAVSKSEVYAIVAKGWSDRSKNSKQGQNETEDDIETKKQIEEQERKEAKIMEKDYIFNIKSIPHDWLFPKIHAAVHHGGAGTTGASLRAGLPTIIKPFFGDQYFYADRVATLGIGSCIRNMTVDNLSTAIKTAVTDEKQIARARLTGEAIRKEDGVGNAIECIYRDLEYARSLIPAPPKLDRMSSNLSDLSNTSIQTGKFNIPPGLSMQALTEELHDGQPPKGSNVESQSKSVDQDVSRHDRDRTVSGQGTNPNSASSSDEWDVVSPSQSITGESNSTRVTTTSQPNLTGTSSTNDTTRSTRWEDESVSSTGWTTSRSTSQNRGFHQSTSSPSLVTSAATGVTNTISKAVTGGLTTAVLEALGRKDTTKSSNNDKA
ncbi:Sterol 3-beta-glucosyltransferase [Microbotryomycetes sp. JL221]|nr:Sterol 3-beta-glucosyltransferase [Microbotryomycetes sp. JL221]